MLDVLVIGSGGAGLSAALAAKKEGASVLVVGKSYPTTSQTSMAQGGMNAALGNVGGDHIDSHIADTIKSAHGICNNAMVRKMCSDAPGAIEWLEEIGVPFSRLDNDKSGIESVAQRQMGGASAKRACYAQDYTGLKILHTLYDNALKEQIEFLDEHFLLNLITDNSRGLTSDDMLQSDVSSAGLTPHSVVKGATFLDIRSGEVVQIDAKSVIIATGGFGALYHGYTTNAYGSTGDGIAAVLRADGSVSDMEFVQFHPTALKHSAILISEAARGEGGYLLNSEGERFVDELKPRDEVARAIFTEFEKGNEVFLDVRHLGAEKLMELLPQEVELCRLHEHVDPVTELIPIKPVAHYTMGGIDVDDRLEVNDINGCFAVGECSSAKIHGANRLGGNSLLEIITFGKFAGENAYKHASNTEAVPADDRQLQKDKAYIAYIYAQDDKVNFYEVRERLGNLLYNKVGIVRENEKLQEALSEVVAMQVSLQWMGIADSSKEHNQNLVEFLEFSNAMLIAPTLISSAFSRDESRGAHYKKGFESKNDEKFKKHIVLQQYKEENA